MLNQLYIKNVAVIDEMEVTVNSGMSVLTGETGAGKSIIIDSINMIMGERANKELVRYGTEKARVQAVFDTNPYVNKILEDNDIDSEDEQLIITRTLTKDGKSAARINGMAVTLGVLREVADGLINIHGQHDNQALLTPAKHIQFLDAYAKDEQELYDCRRAYKELREIHSELSALKTDESEKMQRMDLLKYQINEIEKARLEPGEEEDLKEQRDICANAEKLASAVEEAYTALYEGVKMQSAYDGISIAINALSSVKELAPALKSVYESLSDAVYTIEDAAHELKGFGESVEFDEGALDEIEDRLEHISRLKRKYGRDIEAINEFLKKAKQELHSIETSDERLAELEVIYKEKHTAFKKLADKLSAKRKKAAAELEERIEEALGELNMEKARFKVQVEPSEKLSQNGADRVEFLIGTNPGEPLKPLVKIASGGELSRVMLAIKSVIAADDIVDTMIFDEIDTGVSGKAALKIAAKLAHIGKHKQVICITHLPQLAAAADNHYLISKNVDGPLASTTLTELDYDGRVEELARIIDGGEVSETAKKHARELLDR
ncbi:MAG: DNA repair protein RecN [Clostridiales bacterium]|nr:DNA repair protein RecN [Clostridiales bacterium]